MSGKSKSTLYIAIAIVLIVVIIGGVLAYYFSNQNNGGPGGGTHIDLYAGESPYGFGTTSSSITSPAPTLTFTTGQIYTVTLHNVGAMPHNFAIVTEKTDGNTNLAFSNAQIGSGANPVAPGGSASVTFTAGSAGSYYYICQVGGHVSLGMWGTVTVS